MLDGIEFPPVEVVYDGKDFWLWDGFTRVAAAKSGGFKSIDVNIVKGTHEDAVFKAAGANAMHGQRRTNEDKRKAVSTVLQMKRGAEMSDSALAKMCGVTRPFVTSMRNGSARIVSPPPSAAEKQIPTQSRGAIISGG